MPSGPALDADLLIALAAIAWAAWMIRARRRDARERSAQSSRMRRAIEQSPHTAVLLDAELRILAINRAHLDRFGFGAEQVIGHNYAEFVPDMPMGPREAAAQIFARGSVHFVRDLPLADGTPVPMEHTAIDLGDGTILAVGRELTAERQSALALQTAEQRHEAALDAMRAPVLVLDAQHRIRLANPSAATLLGIDRAALGGRAFSDFILPGERASVIARCTAVAQGAPPAEPLRAQVGHADDRVLDIDMSITQLPATDAGTELLIELRDVTEEHRTLAALQEARDILALSAELTAFAAESYELRTRTLSWSREAHWLFGLDLSAAAPTQEQFFAMLHPDDREEIQRQLAAMIRGEAAPLADGPHRMLLPDGSIGWFRSASVAEMGADGRVARIHGTMQDVTQQHEAALALRASHERLALAERIAHVGSSEYDLPNGRVTWSDEGMRIHGWDPQTTAASPRELLRIVHPDDRERVRAMLAARATGDITPIEPYRIIRANDGQVRWLEERAAQRRDEHGQVTGMIHTVRDITERHEADAALRASRDLLAHAESIAHVGSWEYDARTDNVAWSDEAYRIHGWDPATTTLSGRLIASATHPDDRARMRAAVRNRIAPEVQTSEPYRIIRPDGTVRWIEQHRQAERDAAGTLVRVYGTMRDITEQYEAEIALRASETQLRTVLDAAQSAVMLWSADNRLLYANDSVLTLLGYTFEELAAIDGPLALLHPDDRSAATDARISGAASGTPAPPIVRRLVRKDGTTLTVRSAVIPYPMPDGTYSVLVDAVDLSQETALQEQLVNAQKMEAVGRLVAGVAHDFNNLLTVIQGSLELLARQYGENTWLTNARRSAERAADLVRQLLQFSRAGSGQRTRINLEDLTREVMALVRETFDRRIALDFTANATAPTVLGERTQLQQVLMNLLVNARDAVMERLEQAPPESGYAPTIAITVDSLPAADGTPLVTLTVEDNGAGIPAEVQDRVFEPFFSTKEVGRGTGLGLATVYGIVTGHGGAVTFDSVHGEGTRFTVTLRR